MTDQSTRSSYVHTYISLSLWRIWLQFIVSWFLIEMIWVSVRTQLILFSGRKAFRFVNNQWITTVYLILFLMSVWRFIRFLVFHPGFPSLSTGFAFSNGWDWVVLWYILNYCQWWKEFAKSNCYLLSLWLMQKAIASFCIFVKYKSDNNKMMTVHFSFKIINCQALLHDQFANFELYWFWKHNICENVDPTGICFLFNQDVLGLNP